MIIDKNALFEDRKIAELSLHVKHKNPDTFVRGVWNPLQGNVSERCGKGSPVEDLLHPNECKFQFSYRKEDIYAMVSKLIRENPLF